MSYVALLLALAFTDCVLAGFRAAAGRSGLLDKRTYYRRAVTRAALFAIVLLAANAALAAILCVSSSNATETWATFAAAARPLVFAYGTFATLIFAAFGFYFAPFGDFRVLTNVIVFGPLTLLRPWVIAGALAYVAFSSPGARVFVMAVVAGASMLGFERAFGRRYESQWRALVDAPRGSGGPSRS